MDKDSGLYDSDYSLISENDKVDKGSGDAHEIRPRKKGVDSKVEGHGGFGDEIESEYGDLKELYSCSSTNEEIVNPSRLEYAKFIEEFDMKNP